MLVTCLCLTAKPVRAGSPFALEPKREWILLGTGAALGATSLVLDSAVDPLTPEEIAALDINDVNSFDRGAVKPYRETEAGDGLLYASLLLPFTFLAHEDARQDWRTLGVMWIQTMLLQSGVNGIVKAGVLRTRPYVYDPETPMDKKTSKSARFSFYSGHTSTTAANSFYVARVFHEYLKGRNTRILLWTGAALYPALTGFARRDSGHHWRTDVMTGYVVGGLIGFLVPQLHLSYGNGELSCRPASSFGCTGLAVCLFF
jgi:membrane-associated phospholipid phosphatase